MSAIALYARANAGFDDRVAACALEASRVSGALIVVDPASNRKSGALLVAAEPA
jgi:hypothetical protein